MRQKCAPKRATIMHKLDGWNLLNAKINLFIKKLEATTKSTNLLPTFICE